MRTLHIVLEKFVYMFSAFIDLYRKAAEYQIF